MKLTLESTTKIVTLIVNGANVPARLWEGHTASGIPVHCFITRVAAPLAADQTEFLRELEEQRDPSPDVAAIPLRLII
jgi:hypothetical protein